MRMPGSRRWTSTPPGRPRGSSRSISGADLVAHVAPYVGVLSHLAGLRSAPQMPMAVDRVRWQGEPVAMVVASSRAAAEDAVELIVAEYDELPAACDMETALDRDAPVIHPEFGNNLAWERLVDVGDVDAACSAPGATVVERTFRFGRHTGVTLEPRAAIAEFDPSEQRLTFHYSGQAPHMMQFIFAKHLGLPEENVRVVAEDVGGSFGIKIHTYGDEIATAAVAKLLKRPVKFVADRHESFPDRHPCPRPCGHGAWRWTAGAWPYRRARFRRPDRDRPLLDVPAHLGHRGEPGAQPDRRAL